MMTWFERKEQPNWKTYNVKPTGEELKKWKQEDDTYKLLFWVFFLYVLIDTVFSLF